MFTDANLVDPKDDGMDLGHYRVEPVTGEGACPTCGHGKFWTIVSGIGEEACEIGQHFGDRALTEDICDLMNMAFDAGREDYESQIPI